MNTTYRYPQYEDRGVFNSELYFAILAMRKHGIKCIIESGRARGHSTQVLADNLPDVEIYSIDSQKNTDTAHSEVKLKQYANVHLVYGDSRRIAHKYIKPDTAVFIDGPKGMDAVNLLTHLFDRGAVLGFIHDVYTPSKVRTELEFRYPDATYSDAPEFVNKYRHLDKQVWEHLAETGGIPEAPYIRRGTKIGSYASTLVCIPKP